MSSVTRTPVRSQIASERKGMAWYPLATKRPIAPGPNDPPIEIIGAILHVDAGNSPDLYDYFSKHSGGIESHFHIPKAGPVIQMRDTHYEADANLKGNSFIASNGRRYGYASIETQGLEKGEWNAHQLANIKAVLKWLSETHSFPLRVCKSSTHPGVGYHVMWGAPGAWTPVAKSCPGPDRVRQFENVLTPWFEAGAPGGGADTGGAEVITTDDVDKIAQAVFDKIEPRLKAYTLDMKKYEAQNDVPDAKRAAAYTVAELDARDAKKKAATK